MIGIRADGNAQIGTGHVMRCLAIAQEMKTLGREPVFLCCENSEAVQRAGFRCVTVGGVYDDLSAEDLTPFLSRYNIDKLLVDTYFADAAYLERIPCKTAYLFDLGDESMECDMMAAYNINSDIFEFTRAKTVLRGTEYAPLRREFRDAGEGRDTSRVKNILLTTGGTDELCVTEHILSELCARRAFSALRFQVVVGSMNCRANEIKEIASKYGNVEIHQNVSNMAELMKGCDLAISAGGSTLYELCACALPTVAFSIAQNQDEVVNCMDARGVMLSAGIYAHGGDTCVARIEGALLLLLENGALRRSLAQAAGGLVDGHGAERLAKAIIEL